MSAWSSVHQAGAGPQPAGAVHRRGRGLPAISICRAGENPYKGDDVAYHILRTQRGGSMPDQLRDDINEAWEQMVPTPGLRTSLNRVERLLKPKERVVVMAGGRNEEALGLLVLTDSRALFVSRTVATTIAASLGYAALTAAEMFDEEGQFAIDLSTAGDTVTISEMHEADAQELAALLVEEIAAAAPAPPRRSRVPVVSSAAIPLPAPTSAGTLAAAAAPPPAPVVASPPTQPAAPWAPPSLSPKAAARVEKRYRKAGARSTARSVSCSR